MIPDQALMASIRIFYQPVVRLADFRADYVEVLARTQTPEGVLCGAETVVDAMTSAERSLELTESIMRRTLAEYALFGFAAQNLPVAFNLPLDAMVHPDLLPRIEEIRTRANLPAQIIRFELTETHPVSDLEAARAIITSLRDAGYGLALDDITPGMTNLPLLMEMPIRAIKLDRSVVISTQKSDLRFVREMVARASASGQNIIAEGIESIAIRDAMREMGVTHGQGFLFSRPLSADALQDFCAKT